MHMDRAIVLKERGHYRQAVVIFAIGGRPPTCHRESLWSRGHLLSLTDDTSSPVSSPAVQSVCLFFGKNSDKSCLGTYTT